MKKILLILTITLISVSMVTSLTLTGCKGEVLKVEEETAAETKAPETEVAETVAEKPAVEYKIACFFPAPHPFFEKVQVGLEKFKEDYGIEVYVQYGTDWSQETENQMVEALVAKGYNKIMLYPIDITAANSLYEEITKQGVDVVNLGAEVALPTPSVFTVASDIKGIAMIACEKVIEGMGEKGNLLNILELVEDINTRLRKEGIEEVVAKYPDVKIVQEIAGLTSPEESVEKISNAISALGDDLDGMITTGYVPTVAASQILSEMKNDRIVYVGIDDDEVTLKAIRDGYILGTLAQSPYIMGYMPALLLKLLADGYTPKQDHAFIDAGGVIVTKDNIDAFLDEIWDYAYKVAKTADKDYFNPPESK